VRASIGKEGREKREGVCYCSRFWMERHGFKERREKTEEEKIEI
jgi:hypothetical protein